MYPCQIRISVFNCFRSLYPKCLQEKNSNGQLLADSQAQLSCRHQKRGSYDSRARASQTEPPQRQNDGKGSSCIMQQELAASQTNPKYCISMCLNALFCRVFISDST